jgi:hypothetical protein
VVRPENDSSENEFTSGGKLQNELESNSKGKGGSKVWSVLEEAFIGLFGSGLVANASADVSRDKMFGSGKLTVHGSYYLMCNIKPAVLSDHQGGGIVMQLAKGLIPDPFQKSDTQ